MKLNETLFKEIEADEIEDIDDVYSNGMKSFPIFVSAFIKNEYNAHQMSIEDFASKVIPKAIPALEYVIDNNMCIYDRSELFFINDWFYHQKKLNTEPQTLNGYCSYIVDDDRGNFSISFFIHPEFTRHYQVRKFIKDICDTTEKIIKKVDNTLYIFSIEITETSSERYGLAAEDYYHTNQSTLFNSKYIASAYSILLPRINPNAMVHSILSTKAQTLIEEGLYKDEILKYDEVPAQFKKRKIKIVSFDKSNGENLINLADRNNNIISPVWFSAHIDFDYVMLLVLYGDNIYNKKFDSMPNHPPRKNMININSELVFEKWIDFIREIKTEYGVFFQAWSGSQRNYLNQYGAIIGEQWETSTAENVHLQKLSFNDGYEYYIDNISAKITIHIYRKKQDGTFEEADEMVKIINEIKPEKKKKPTSRRKA